VDEDSLESWADRRAASNFALVGLGGAGSDTVHDLRSLGSLGVRSFAVNTDLAHLKRIDAEERILIGHRQLRGRGSGGDRHLVLDAAEESREELVQRLSRFEVVFLLAGLGGGTGSALLPYLSTLLRRTETLPVPVAFLPFQVELETNPERKANVIDTLADLEGMGGLLLALSNEKLRRFESLPLHRVFQVRSAYLHNMLASLVDMVDHPSQLNVDLASLKTHLRDSGLSTLICAERHYSEPERLVQQALTESLLDFDLPSSPSALVHLEGGSNMTLRIFGQILEALRFRLGNPRRIAFGTRTRPEPREVVRLTAVVGGLQPRAVREALLA
jgi:cell division protein FtsZ